MSVDSRKELNVIANILKDEKTLNVTQLGYDEGLSGVGTRICYLEESNEWREHEYKLLTDTTIDISVQRQKEQLSIALCNIDAKILKSIAVTQHLESKLGPALAFDYRPVTLPLVKNFLLSYLKDLEDRDAAEKSKAAYNVFPDELEKNADKSGDTKHAVQKSRDKKKNKKHQKSKVAEASSHNDRHLLNQKTVEEFTFVGDNNVPDHELTASEDYTKQEEELKLRMELQAEVRKHEKTLQHQRRIVRGGKKKASSWAI